MHRNVDQAAAVLGLKPSTLRQRLRELGVLNQMGELACKYREGPYFFVETRQRWNPHFNSYAYYGVVMVTEAGVGWLARKLDEVEAPSFTQASWLRQLGTQGPH